MAALRPESRGAGTSVFARFPPGAPVCHVIPTCAARKVSRPSALRGPPKHDVEPGGQLADARAGDRDERHGDGRLRLGITDLLIDAVARVAGKAFDEQLRVPRL